MNIIMKKKRCIFEVSWLENMCQVAHFYSIKSINVSLPTKSHWRSHCRVLQYFDNYKNLDYKTNCTRIHGFWDGLVNTTFFSLLILFNSLILTKIRISGNSANEIWLRKVNTCGRRIPHDLTNHIEPSNLDIPSLVAVRNTY